MKNFKRIISLIAVFTILCTFLSMPVLAGSATEAKQSVVVVGNQQGTGQGSGFAIGKVGKPVQYIVTNNHVVRGDLGNTLAVVAFDAASGEEVLANIYYYNEEKDVAILKLPQPTEKRKALVLCPMKYVDPDDSFAALGYPGNQITDWPKYSMDDITITKGGIKKADRLMGLDVYMLDLTITHGNSGGPLVNSKGEVVGINTFGAIDDSYAIAIDELIAVIDRDRIPVTIHGDVNWLIIAAILVLVIIIVLVIVLIASKNGGNSKRVVAGAYSTGVAGGEGGMNVTTPLSVQNVQPAQQNNAPGARLVAIGGTLNGRRFNITGTVRMGRDSSKCGIAFPVNTQGVSGVHCEIAFDGAVCYVKDLGSSYGTFKMDGRKLAPNQPEVLKSGDKFYLASTANTFEVRF